MAQTLVTAVLVGGSAIYVVWALLLPAAARRRLARALLKLRWPSAVVSRLQARARAPSGCGCEGCDTRAPSPTAQPVHWAPRRKE